MIPRHLVHTVAFGDYMTVYRARWSAAEGATMPSSRVSLSPILPPMTTPTAAAALVAITGVPVPNLRVKFVDPLHHTTTLTPSAKMPPGALQALDTAQIIYLVSTLHP